jgi:hypothetical protein
MSLAADQLFGHDWLVLAVRRSGRAGLRTWPSSARAQTWCLFFHRIFQRILSSTAEVKGG